LTTHPASEILSPLEFEQISELVYGVCGIDLKNGKQQLVQARLGKLIRQGKFGSFAAYYRHVVADRTGEELIGMLATHAALALENAELHERSRELSTIEERKRLARELHDSVTQTLFSIGLTAEAASALVESKPERARAELETLQELTRTALEEMRSLIFELRPAELETDGLAAALRKHVDVLRRLHPQEIELSVAGERRLPAAVEKGLLRIAQEALGNALRHSGAERVELALDVRDSHAQLRVADDGAGFEVETARPRHLGLTSMRERAEALGGRLEIDSVAGRGTTVSVEV